MRTIHLNGKSIQCLADKDGATIYEIQRYGILYKVTAHSKQEAEETIEGPIMDRIDDPNQPALLPEQ